MNRSISVSCSPARSIATTVHSVRRLTAVWNVSWPSTRSSRSSWVQVITSARPPSAASASQPDRAAAVAAENDRSGAVAPQGGGLAVVVVRQAGEHLRADQQPLVDTADLEHPGGQRQPAQPAAARRAHVDGSGAQRAEPVGDLRRGVRGHLVLAEARHQHQVDLGRVDVRVGERLAAGPDRQIGYALAGCDPAALADPGALDDPNAVVDADTLRDLVVGDDLVGQVVAQSEHRSGARRGSGAAGLGRSVVA